jgi:hypothetical protein
MKILTTLVSLALCYSRLTGAQEANTEKWHGTVSVDISASATDKSPISSFIRRELRSLSDVDITDSRPDYIIEVVAIEDQTKTGAHFGYTLSTVVLETFPTNSLAFFQIGNTNTLTALEKVCANYSIVCAHFVVTGSDMRELCSRVVAQCDTDVFDYDRQNYAKAMKLFRDAQKTIRDNSAPPPPSKTTSRFDSIENLSNQLDSLGNLTLNPPLATNTQPVKTSQP